MQCPHPHCDFRCRKKHYMNAHIKKFHEPDNEIVFDPFLLTDTKISMQMYARLF